MEMMLAENIRMYRKRKHYFRLILQSLWRWRAEINIPWGIFQLVEKVQWELGFFS